MNLGTQVHVLTNASAQVKEGRGLFKRKLDRVLQEQPLAIATCTNFHSPFLSERNFFHKQLQETHHPRGTCE